MTAHLLEVQAVCDWHRTRIGQAGISLQRCDHCVAYPGLHCTRCVCLIATNSDAGRYDGCFRRVSRV